MRSSPLLIGRGAELGALSAVVEETREGRARGVLVRGAPGVGKTRLLHEAANESSGRGVRVAQSSCLPLTTTLPFDPILELLRSLREPLPAAVTESPRELFGIVVDRLERATVEGPLLLCLDDLQWSDAGTLDLVHYCLARLTDLPIAWLMAARPAAAVERLTHRLVRAGVLEQLELRAMSGAEVRQLAEAILGDDRVSDRLASALYERTGGNPFLCEELLRALGDVAHSSGDATGELDRLVPGSVSEAIAERVSRLPAGAREALGWAAVLPEPFTFEELEAAGGEELGSAPESLAAASFVHGDGRGGWSFVHSIVRDAVYQRLPERERVRRHGVVADLLADGPLERRAPQLAAARRWQEAARGYIALGESALTRGRGEDARRLFERARELAASAGDAELDRAGEAGQVLALLRAGAGEQAKHRATALRAELRSIPGSTDRLKFLGEYALALLECEDVEAAREVLDEADTLLADAEDRTLARVLAARSYVSMYSGNLGAVIETAERAVTLARRTSDPVSEVNALTVLGIALARSRGVREAQPVLENAAERAVEEDLPAQAANAFWNLGACADLAGDVEAFRTHLERGLQFEGAPAATTVGIQGALSHALSGSGDLDAALSHALAAVRRAERAGARVQARARLWLAQVHLRRWELESARRLLADIPDTYAEPDVWGMNKTWGVLLEREGALQEALARFRSGCDATDHAAECATGTVRLAVALGDTSTAHAAILRLEELAERWPVCGWMLEEARAWIAVGEHRNEVALRHFDAAISGCSEAWAAAGLLLQSALLKSDRAQVSAAIDAFERMGAIPAADHARKRARSAGMRPGRRRAAAGALSAREQEITELVAAGQTNAEIAAALYLSPRTVEHYVSNILTKLGYRSRVQIATEAAAGRLGRGTTPSRTDRRASR